jgi:hypothetical protein
VRLISARANAISANRFPVMIFEPIPKISDAYLGKAYKNGRDYQCCWAEAWWTRGILRQRANALERRNPDHGTGLKRLERVKGIEPSYSAWKAAAMPHTAEQNRT